jgi:hypothetical protein
MRLNSTGLGIGTSSPVSGGGGGLTLGSTSSGKSFHVYSSSYANNGLGNFYGTDGNMKLQMGASSSTSAYVYANTGCSLVLYSGGNTTATLDSAGNLGLGVTPDASDWNASMRVFHAYQNTSNGAGVKLQSSNSKMIMSAGNALNYVGSIGSTPLYFVMNSATNMVLDTSGNLGIGTTSPSGRLHVNSTGAAVAYIQSTLSAGNTNVETRYISTNRTWGVGQNIIQASAIFEIADVTAGATRLAIDSSGNVGIGANSPSSYLSGTAKLVVLANANSQHSILIRNDSTGSSASTAFVLNASGNAWGIEMGSSAKNNNALTFQLDYGGTNATKMTLDTYGNLGLGVTPSAWASDWKVMQIGSRSAFAQYNGNSSALVTNNVYFAGSNGSNPTYINTAASSFYQQVNGAHVWYNAPSGTAGNAIIFTPAMTLNASGQRMLGTTTPYGIDTVSKTANNGTAVATNISDFGGSISVIHNQDEVGTGNKNGLFFAHAGSPGLLSGIASTKLSGTWQTTLDFYVNNLTGGDTGTIQLAARIDSSGNLGATGTISASSELQSGSAIRAYGNQARLHFWSFIQGTMNGGYVHMKTNVYQTNTQMYSVHFSGHDYSGAKAISATLGWYNYNPSNGPISIGGNAGTHSVSAYQSSDGYTVMVLGPTGGYYTAFTVSQYLTTQSLADLTITASASSGSATGVY